MAIITDANIPTTGIGGPSPAPDYTPPSIIWKDADEIYVPKGRYPKLGYRFNGQYQDLSNGVDYWDVADRFAVDIDATYSAGATSGMIGGAKVNSSWYSVFMVGSVDLLILPFVRADTITYSAPNTVISPAAHADGTTAADGFIVANDAWNGYRLILINDDPTESGNVYTISDCTTGSPDTILISGDVTSQISATEWLQLVPPADVPCLYLGFVQINDAGNLSEFDRNGWEYTIPSYSVPSSQIYLNFSTSAANTDLGAVLPPVVKRFRAINYNSVSSGSSRGIVTRFYKGLSGTTQNGAIRYSTDTAVTNLNFNGFVTYTLTATTVLRNMAVLIDSSGVEQAAQNSNLAFKALQE